MIKVYCYSKCGTCKKALKWLDENNIEHEDIDIKTVHPDKDTLKKYYAQSGLPLKRFFNTSGIPYRELGLSKKLPDMSEEEQQSSKTEMHKTKSTSGVVCPQVRTNYPRGWGRPQMSNKAP